MTIMQKAVNDDDFPTVGPDLSVTSFEVVSSESAYLDRHGLNSFAGLFAYVRKNAMRDVRGRLTVRMELSDGNGARRVFYLKRHWLQVSAGRVGKAAGEARAEWENTKLLQEAGLAVPQPIAWGVARQGPWECALYLCEEVPGRQADHFIAEHWPRMSAQGRALLLRRIGECAARFHSLGFNHQDFYLCHFFVHEQAGDFLVSLIDLQRMQKRRFLSWRYQAKDLGQLFYSSWDLLSRVERWRLMRSACGERWTCLTRLQLWLAAGHAVRIARRDVRKGLRRPEARSIGFY